MKRRTRLFLAWGALLLPSLLLLTLPLTARERLRTQRHGFDVSYTLVPPASIVSGGVPVDGIPALTSPPMQEADRATWLAASDLVVGVEVDGRARAYPLRILVWHEVINDWLGGKPIAVTYCPLCNAAMVFDRQFGAEVLEFGVSGLLYNSNLLLYDRRANPADRSLWSQVKMKAVAGPAAKAELDLTLLPAGLYRWDEWHALYPDTTVVSVATGYDRNYAVNPYDQYQLADPLLFGVNRSPQADRFDAKEMMVVVQVGDAMRAYPVNTLLRVARDGTVKDRLGTRDIVLELDETTGYPTVRYADRKTLRPPTAYMYWFVLDATYPEMEVYTAE